MLFRSGLARNGGTQRPDLLYMRRPGRVHVFCERRHCLGICQLNIDSLCPPYAARQHRDDIQDVWSVDREPRG